jgi:putative transposase
MDMILFVSLFRQGYLMSDYARMMVAIPLKYAISQVVGYIKGKSAIHLTRVHGERKRNFIGQHFSSARRYFV